jgi:hypothetical protein
LAGKTNASILRLKALQKQLSIFLRDSCAIRSRIVKNGQKLEEKDRNLPTESGDVNYCQIKNRNGNGKSTGLRNAARPVGDFGKVCARNRSHIRHERFETEAE